MHGNANIGMIMYSFFMHCQVAQWHTKYGVNIYVVSTQNLGVHVFFFPFHISFIVGCRKL